jgi:hypothetical protein
VYGGGWYWKPEDEHLGRCVAAQIDDVVIAAAPDRDLHVGG